MNLLYIFFNLKKTKSYYIKILSFYVSILVFLWSVFLLNYFVQLKGYSDITNGLVYNEYIRWFLFFDYMLIVDGISVVFILLTTFLVPLCLLVSWYSVTYKVGLFVVSLLISEFFLLNFFAVTDLVLFYFFFECVLIPLFFLIGVWGSRKRRVLASYQFFMYTLIGSLVMLCGILFVYFHSGTTDIRLLYYIDFSFYRQLVLWFAFFVAFAVKVPFMPVHVWLPEAHVEAPTAGSVILAGVLLKLGSYGFLRFSMPLFPDGTFYFMPFLYMLGVLGVIYSSLTTIRQIDFKKIIAYSSVAHMNFCLLGLFVITMQSLSGSVFLMVGHGLVSSGLFLSVGLLYDRYHTRIVRYYGGLTSIMPLLSTIFLILTFANMGLPGCCNFVGEFLIMLGVFEVNPFICFLGGCGLVLSGVYAIWLYNRLFFGFLNKNFIYFVSDVSLREFVLLFIIVILVLVLGIYPNLLFKLYEGSLLTIVCKILF